jgi:hypothetical protein
MQSQEISASGPHDSRLLHLLTHMDSGSRLITRYFVCTDCLDLVERTAEATQGHACPANAQESLKSA